MLGDRADTRGDWGNKRTLEMGKQGGTQSVLMRCRVQSKRRGSIRTMSMVSVRAGTPERAHMTAYPGLTLSSCTQPPPVCPFTSVPCNTWHHLGPGSLGVTRPRESHCARVRVRAGAVTMPPSELPSSGGAQGICA